MGLQNYFPQKNLLRGLGNSLDELNRYAGTLNRFAQELNDCWAGNADKKAVFEVIQAQMKALDRLRQDVNWVHKTADWALEKMNELGSLAGLAPPHIAGIPYVRAPSAALSSLIRLDTGKLGTAASSFAFQPCSALNSAATGVRQIQLGLDFVLRAQFGIAPRITACTNAMQELTTRHNRLAAAVKRIAGIYEDADRAIRKRAEGLLSLPSGSLGENEICEPGVGSYEDYAQPGDEGIKWLRGKAIEEVPQTVAEVAVENVAAGMAKTIAPKAAESVAKETAKAMAGMGAAGFLGGLLSGGIELVESIGAGESWQQVIGDTVAETALGASSAIAGAAIGGLVGGPLGVVVGAGVGILVDGLTHLGGEGSFAEAVKGAATETVKVISGVAGAVADGVGAVADSVGGFFSWLCGN